MLRAIALSCLILSTFSCGGPPKPTVPSLNPQEAAELLHYNPRAENWLKNIQKQDPSCTYSLTLPDQSSHPTTIDLTHIVLCNGRPSPLQFDASVSFIYEAETGKWKVERFAS